MEHFDGLFDLGKLISGYLKNELRDEEYLQLNEWLSEGPDNRAKFKRLIAEKKITADLIQLETIDTGLAWTKIVSKTNSSKNSKLKKYTISFAVAASLLVFILAGAYFIFKSPHPADTSGIPHSYQNDIKAGSNKAILTLANGQQILLASVQNGALATQGHTIITKSAKESIVYNAGKISNKFPVITYNTIATPSSGKWEVVLPDKSHVWLDALSSIRFPTAFNSDHRDIEMTGQAYFEIAHDASKPFRVKSKGQTIEVLGTHFNVNAYQDEPFIRTTLLEGRVKINQNTVLKPGEQALNTGEQVKIEKVDTSNAIGWKNDDFVFTDQSFEEAMRTISRWYDVEVIYDHVNTNKILPGGWISRKNNISVILNHIESTGAVHFKIEGRRVIITQ